MVMDNLPRTGFSAIDVRDAMLDGDLLSGKRNLPALDTQFVGQTLGGLNDLIVQFDLAPCREMSDLLK